MVVDKNQAMINYLNTCTAIQNNPLYFNFINAKNDNKQIITLTNEKAIAKTYVDGSVLKMYSLVIVDFKSIAYKPVVKQTGYSDENVEDMLSVQQIIDWIDEQNEAHNYPDFGTDCVVENISATSDNPMLDGIDTSISPALAQYSITIEVTYLDTSKVLWGK